MNKIQDTPELFLPVQSIYETFSLTVLLYMFVAGAFLIPYFIILLVCGVPMLFMELAIGQYTARGPIGALSQICPLFKGKT